MTIINSIEAGTSADLSMRMLLSSLSQSECQVLAIKTC